MKENELIQTVQKLQREHRWEDAIAKLQQYKQLNKKIGSDRIYILYARSLRILGRGEQAEAILEKGLQLFPNSERILLEFHNLYDFLGEWKRAITVAKQLIKMNSKHPDYHFRLGRSYSFLNKYKKAKQSYQTAIACKHNMHFSDVIDKVVQPFKTQKLQSQYVFIDGKNNLGAFLHEHKDEPMFTKISKYTNANNGAGREAMFYKDVCNDFPQLVDIVPKFKNVQTMDKITYLTIEKIDSVPVQPTKAHIEKIIEASNIISSVKYDDVKEKYRLPDYVFQFRKGRAISVVHFFTQIHDEFYNQKMFEAIELIMQQYHYPKMVRQLIQRLKTVIVDNQLYQYISPKEHYALLHGDFAFQNVLMHKEDESPRVIDWTSFTIGPHFIDLARFFTSQLLSYSEVKAWYLEGDAGKKLTSIEKIFFLYALILFYFQKFGNLDRETRVSQFILPALEDLELLVMQFNQSKEKAGGDLKNNSVEQKELEIKQLQQRLEVIQAERNNLEKRLNDVLTSKSWKITAPLRLFMENKRES